MYSYVHSWLFMMFQENTKTYCMISMPCITAQIKSWFDLSASPSIHECRWRMWRFHEWPFFVMPLSTSLTWNWAQGAQLRQLQRTRSWMNPSPLDKWNPNISITRWFKVTFLSPIWRSLNPWKGHLTIPKRSPRIARYIYIYIIYIYIYITRFWSSQQVKDVVSILRTGSEG